MNKTVLTILLLIVSQISFSKEYIFCNTCTSKIEFINYAKGSHGQSGGTTDYQVINYATEELWDVTVERSYEPEVGLYLNFAFGTVSSQEDINDFIALKEVIALKDILILIPPGSGNGGGGDGFSGYNPSVINGHIT